MAFEMDDETLQSLLAPVARYAREKIAPLCQRHEMPLDNATHVQIWQDLDTMGLLTNHEEGYALWEHPTADSRLFSLRSLQHIAQADAGIALATHHHCLSQAMRNLFKWPLASYSSLDLAGRYGLLGLFDSPAVARDNYSHQPAPLLRQQHSLFAGGTCMALLWQDGPLLADLQDCINQPLRNHGFNEQLLHSWHSGEIHQQALLDDATLRHLLSCEWLGLSAIAYGVLRRSFKLAQDYATLRRQGGQHIGQYPAVQQMLATCMQTLQHSRLHMEHVAKETDFFAACDLYCHTLPALRKAAQQCVQVFGGMGYMQDTGVEKALREINHLGHISGNPMQCHLFRAGQLNPDMEAL
jgi:acyl-CoA dehydrogenase